MEYIICDQHLVLLSEFSEPADSTLIVYEVMRIIDFIPLFYDDHYARLLHSVELVGQHITVQRAALFRQLCELCQINDKAFGNIMLKVYFQETGYCMYAGFTPHDYPVAADYDAGVKVGLLHAERSNPEAKVVNVTVREKANQLMAEKGVYEVLLVDRHQLITEGSRSNFMAIRNQTIYTAPLSTVLNGITLLKVLQIAKAENIPVHTECIAVQQLQTFDALFLTGTSPKLLPVSKVEDVEFNVKNPVLLRLMAAYQKLMDDDIAKKRDSFRNP